MEFSTREKLSAATSVACVGLMIGIILDESGVINLSKSFSNTLSSVAETQVPSNHTAGIVYGDWQAGEKKITAMCESLTPSTAGMNYSEKVDFLDSREVKASRREAIRNMQIRTDQIQGAIEDRVDDEIGIDVNVDAHTSILCDTEQMGEEHVYKNVLGFSDNAWMNETVCTFNNVDSTDGLGVDVLNWTCESALGGALNVQTIYVPTGGSNDLGRQIAGTK